MNRRAAPPPAESLLLELRKERIAEVISRRTRTLVVVLDCLEDTFNMAAVLRTCEGQGVQEVHVTENPAVPFVPHPKVSQGCDKWLDIFRYKSFEPCREALKARGFALWVSAAGPQSESVHRLSFDGKVALAFGNERTGVSEEVLRGADGRFWLPMRGFTQSLNVSAAAASVVSHAVAWRQQRWGRTGDLSPEEAAAMQERFYMLSVKQRRKLYPRAPR